MDNDEKSLEVNKVLSETEGLHFLAHSFCNWLVEKFLGQPIS